jgi:two-component system sensor histidine kinase RegB
MAVSIGDDGPGFSPEVLPRLGEPYVSTRPREGRGAGSSPTGDRADGYEGMGLGVFIARTLLARTGASLRFMNAPGKAPADERGEGPTGALILVRWPSASIRESKSQGRRAFGDVPAASGLAAEA